MFCTWWRSSPVRRPVLPRLGLDVVGHHVLGLFPRKARQHDDCVVGVMRCVEGEPWGSVCIYGVGWQEGKEGQYAPFPSMAVTPAPPRPYVCVDAMTA